MGTPLRELFARFTTEFDTSALKSGAAAVDGLFGKLKTFGAALAGGAIVGGLIGLTKHVIESGDNLATQADRLGLSAQALQQWQYVADLCDVSAEELGGSMRILQRNIEGAAAGSGDAVKDFNKVGLSLQDLKGSDLDAVLVKLADGFKGLTNPIERTALAQKLLGRGGAALVPLLAKGAAGVAELKEEFLALGGGLSQETIDAANEADDAFKRLAFGLKGITYNAVRPLIHWATEMAGTITKAVKVFYSWTAGTNIVTGALVALGVAAGVMAWGVITAFAPIILSTLAIAAGIAAAIVVVDDLITLFQGGKSVLGDWIDETYGVGTAGKVVETLKGYWDDLVPAIGSAWDVFQSILPTIKTVSDSLRAVGDDIAFVVDQFRHLSEFKEGAKKIFADFVTGQKTDDQKKFAHGADGFGSVVSHTDAQGNTLTPEGRPGEGPLDAGARGGFGFTRGFARFAGDSSKGITKGPAAPGSDPANPAGPTGPQAFSGAVKLPEVTIAGPAAPTPAAASNKTVVVNVAANAKPDAALIHTVKTAVEQGMATKQRADLAATVGG